MRMTSRTLVAAAWIGGTNWVSNGVVSGQHLQN